MNTPKRHHLVPEFYLRRFSDGEKVVLVDRNDLSRRFPSTVENALVERHFYSIDTQSGRDPGIERMLAEHIEPRGERAIRRLVEDARPCSMQGLRRGLALFLAFQFIRGPASRHAAVEFFKANVQKVTSVSTPEMIRESIRKETGKELDDDELAEIVAFARDPSRYRIAVSSEVNLHMADTLPIALELVPYFEKRR